MSNILRATKTDKYAYPDPGKKPLFLVKGREYNADTLGANMIERILTLRGGELVEITETLESTETVETLENTELTQNIETPSVSVESKETSKRNPPKRNRGRR